MSDHYIRSRIANACDGCKARKVKCDGKVPCSYCARRQRPHACHYSPQRRRRTAAAAQDHQQNAQPPRSPPHSDRESRSRSTRNNTGSPVTPSGTGRPATSSIQSQSSSHHHRDASAQQHQTSSSHHRRNSSAQHQRQRLETSPEDETEVPREARLVCDAQGKLIFVGDCAPLSFFQSVRQLVTQRVGPNAFAPQSSRYSVLENAPAHQSRRIAGDHRVPVVCTDHIPLAVSTYLSTSTGLVDLFDNNSLLGDLVVWANLGQKPDDSTSIVNFLVLAIGRQMDDEELAQDYFEYARDKAFSNLSGNLSVTAVQAFTLVTIYMLCSCQINGAFLYFGIAVRAAYSIGIHRTEVNARFGPDVHRQRDRLWKSLRIVDLFLSSSMGRPPATSDVDCTVPYHAAEDDTGDGPPDLLNASVQIFLILEGVVTEIYSRRKISLQLTEGISLQLRDWSLRWLKPLKAVLADPATHDQAQVSGACQILSTYYYSVMLVSRPFLMYELCQRLSNTSAPSPGRPVASGKLRLADACVDAASLMVDPILDLMERGALVGRVPILVSWLFASSLVLGIGLLGGFGRILEKYTRMSIQALDHCSKHDTHARQYSLIAQSLLNTALESLEKRELQERMRRTESSSQLFGLIPCDADMASMSPASHTNTNAVSPAVLNPRSRDSLDRSFLQHNGLQAMASPRFGDLDSAFLGISESMLQTPDAGYWGGNAGWEADSGSALNLFALLDAGGGIDLAHHL